MPIPVPGRARIKVVRESRRSRPGNWVRAITQAIGTPTRMQIKTEIPEYSRLLRINLGVSMATRSKYCRVYLTGKGVSAHPLPKESRRMPR